MDKKGGKSHFGYKLHSIIDRDYELIRRFKTTTESLYDSQVNLSEKMKWFTETEDTLEQNQKVMMQQWKKVVKEHPLGMSDILRNKRISSKDLRGTSLCSN